eukprot:TRINITY_DN19675_c1_g1_i1.p3 TRINITY_DN19675_c1_g1~~TRINITY_DN19675_c1_g1_i1.p3  ORF type:complete len:101 (+),score=17.04 TRINITY_DN19675_c1_g1_i1:164-466(+)
MKAAGVKSVYCRTIQNKACKSRPERLKLLMHGRKQHNGGAAKCFRGPCLARAAMMCRTLCSGVRCIVCSVPAEKLGAERTLSQVNRTNSIIPNLDNATAS